LVIERVGHDKESGVAGTAQKGFESSLGKNVRTVGGRRVKGMILAARV